MIAFSNNGIIDPSVWETFGVSVKDCDNAIGRFGTGLKYAIAVLLREGRRIYIACGDGVYDFDVEDMELRGKTFKRVTCNGQPLPFTTELGQNWELWQAYRELYSNCLDEGGWMGEDGETVVFAELDNINHNDVFLDKSARRCMLRHANVDVYEGESQYIYMNGIRVKDLHTRSKFTYDYKHLDLTEDRTVRNEYQLGSFLSTAIFSATEREFLFEWLTQTKDWWESNVDLDWGSTPAPNDVHRDIARDLRRTGKYFQGSAFRLILKTLKDEYNVIEPKGRQKGVIDRAMEFLERMGEPVEYPIDLIDNMEENIMGKTDPTYQRIKLSTHAVDRGIKYTAATLYEENLHLKTGLRDCTYEMQTFLFDKIITLGEELLGEVL